jgi:hypothetical protein
MKLAQLEIALRRRRRSSLLGGLSPWRHGCHSADQLECRERRAPVPIRLSWRTSSRSNGWFWSKLGDDVNKQITGTPGDQREPGPASLSTSPSNRTDLHDRLTASAGHGGPAVAIASMWARSRRSAAGLPDEPEHRLDHVRLDAQLHAVCPGRLTSGVYPPFSRTRIFRTT